MLDDSAVATFVMLYNMLAGLLLVVLLFTAIYRRVILRVLGRVGDPTHMDRLVYREVGRTRVARLCTFAVIAVVGSVAMIAGTWSETWTFHAGITLWWTLGAFYGFCDMTLLSWLFRFCRLAMAQSSLLRNPPYDA